MMPPPGVRRPSDETLQMLVETLESVVDAAAAENPNPGHRTFQRLNRPEYERAVHELLALEIDAAAYLPPDTMSANFDNISDVQTPSATLSDSYLRAASRDQPTGRRERQAWHPSKRPTRSRALTPSGSRSEGAPYGTRGGFSVVHDFRADGRLHHQDGVPAHDHGAVCLVRPSETSKIEVSINGEPVATLPDGSVAEDLRPHRCGARDRGAHLNPSRSATRVCRLRPAIRGPGRGPCSHLTSGRSSTLRSGDFGYGITGLPHMRDLTIDGPYSVTGISDTPSRRAIFTCRPTSPDREHACAEEIISRLAARAYRRPATSADLDDLLGFYEAGAREGWIRSRCPNGVASLPGKVPTSFSGWSDRPTRSRSEATTTVSVTQPWRRRLSFFLWGGAPDDTLMELASAGRLSVPAVLEAQTRRLLADPRAETLATRFARSVAETPRHEPRAA